VGSARDTSLGHEGVEGDQQVEIHVAEFHPHSLLTIDLINGPYH
jgi:hypothetical protein